MAVKRLTAVFVVATAAFAAACSDAGPGAIPAAVKPLPVGASPTVDAATRASPVVVARPARVFVMTSFDKNCRSLPDPDIKITQPPAKGDITFKPGQQTVLAATSQGTCIGKTATGTGIYYTARAGTRGTDRFAIEARTQTGDVATRTFEVNISE